MLWRRATKLVMAHGVDMNVLACGTAAVVDQIALDNLDVRNSYYGLNFQDNGDVVRGTRLRFYDVRRSYFPYGVDDHDVTLSSEANSTGSTDLLIKCYRRPTTNIVLNASSAGKRQGDAILAFEQEHVDGRGLIRGVRVNLDVSRAACALKSVIRFAAYDTSGGLESVTRSEWSDIALDGAISACPSTKIFDVASAPQVAGVVRIGAQLGAGGMPATVGGLAFEPA